VASLKNPCGKAHGSWSNTVGGVAVGGGWGWVGSRSWVDTLVPGRGTVDTHGLSNIAVARLEDTRVVISRHVPVTTHNIVDVLA